MALFKIQARVIDLLGEQQIANCPTAISELFKNAYDACAAKVMMDVYPEDDYAVLWDDGIGMSEKDVLERWLVVGTANKNQNYRPSDVNACGRIIQGEKGIGRLAISTLGDSLFLIGKIKNAKPGIKSYTALFINWNIVRNDRLMLEDIEVPVMSFSDFDDLGEGMVADMIQQFRAPLLRMQNESVWEGTSGRELFSLIMNQLDNFKLDMPSIRRSGLARHESGALFYIRHLKEDIPNYIIRPPRNQRDEEPNIELIQLLNNFQNNFEKTEVNGLFPENVKPFQADVRRWDPVANILVSVFNEWEAISADDLFAYDHYMDVCFDEWGHYNGELEVFNQKYLLSTHGTRPKQPLKCGSFRLCLWCFQGERNKSRLAPEQWELINKKLIYFGGLMVYRDGLRVLPYGRPEFDWLRFEERRSKGFGRYFFSYRRMFGYVAISRKNNPGLKDKAGREGLLSNYAYRQFKEILTDFFSEIALRYFGKTESFKQEKEKLKRKSGLIQEEQRRTEEQRKKIYQMLSDRIECLKNTDEKIGNLIRQHTGELEHLENIDSPEAALAHFNDRLVEMENEFRVPIPDDLAADLKTERIIYDYKNAFDAFTTLCSEARQTYSQIVAQRYDNARRMASYRNTLRKGYKNVIQRIESKQKDILFFIETMSETLKADLEEFSRNHIRNINESLLLATSSDTLEEALSSFHGDALSILGTIEKTASESVAEYDSLLSRMKNAIDSIFGTPRDVLIAAQTEEIEKLRTDVDRNLELVQLGLSVEIIDHELNRLYRGIHAGLKRLKMIIRKAPNALIIAESLENNFQHMEQKYKLMSPLYRGSYRKKSEISGKQIINYIQTFLDIQITSIGLQITDTDSFRNWSVSEIPSAVLPVFVNLADNAIYWLKNQTVPKIVFDRISDRKGSVITVCDNGPGIHETLLEEVFTPFFSTKPGGRGLGLYIARANLTRYGHDIWATNDPAYRTLPGACFCVRFRSESLTGDNKS